MNHSDLDENQRDHYEEHAAKREYDAGFTRKQAERLALEAVAKGSGLTIESEQGDLWKA